VTEPEAEPSAQTEPEAEPSARADPARLTPRRALALGALAALVLALLIAVAIPATRVLSARSAAADTAAALDAARQETLNLTTMSFQTADQDIKRLLDGTTGEFRDQFQQRIKPFTDIVRQAKVVTTGKISEAGVESSTVDAVTVLVAATAQVTNTAAPTGTPRDYRLRLTVRQVDGRWLVSNVDFVP